MKKLLSLNAIGLVLLVAAFVASVARVVSVQREFYDPNKKVIRIAHWQLEAGYREALQKVIDEYNRRHAADGVMVVQMPLMQKVFPQVINTHLISGTAPELVERDGAKNTMYNSLPFTARYFMPLTEASLLPNPYNAPAYLPKGMDPALAQALPGLAWRETFSDGMKGGWVSELQEYYAAPTSFSTIRLLYNKQMVDQAKQLMADGMQKAGDPVPAWLTEPGPPNTLGQLLAMCKVLRTMHTPEGGMVTPIAGTAYNIPFFQAGYDKSMLNSYGEKLDTDYSGEVTALETMAGLSSKAWSFDDRQARAFYECLRAICDQFGTGFLAKDRDQAVFMFVQQQSAFMAAGSWDAANILATAKFPAGVMRFPLPVKGEPFSEFAQEKFNEAGDTGNIPYMVNKTSPNWQWGLDFLQFLTSYRWNEEYNRNANWIPIVIGTTPSENMAGFMPDPEGIAGTGRLRFDTKSQFDVRFRGAFEGYLSGENTYEQFTAQVHSALADSNAGLRRVFWDAWDRDRRQVRDQERSAAVQKARWLLLDQADAQAKLATIVTKQAIANNGEAAKATWAKLFKEPFPDY